MKPNNFKLAIAALTAATFFTAMPSMKILANNTNPVVATQVQPTINIKVLGQQDEFVILEINLSQPAIQNSKLTINDDRGDVMYEENVSAKVFNRKIKVAPFEMNKIQVLFSTPNGEIKKYYAINVSLVSKVDVTEASKN